MTYWVDPYKQAGGDAVSFKNNGKQGRTFSVPLKSRTLEMMRWKTSPGTEVDRQGDDQDLLRLGGRREQARGSGKE